MATEKNFYYSSEYSLCNKGLRLQKPVYSEGKKLLEWQCKWSD